MERDYMEVAIPRIWAQSLIGIVVQLNIKNIATSRLV